MSGKVQKEEREAEQGKAEEWQDEWKGRKGGRKRAGG
jgi:hypothetical protein